MLLSPDKEIRREVKLTERTSYGMPVFRQRCFGRGGVCVSTCGEPPSAHRTVGCGQTTEGKLKFVLLVTKVTETGSEIASVIQIWTGYLET